MTSKEFGPAQPVEHASTSDEAGARAEQRKHILAATTQKIGPIVCECLLDLFASLGLSMPDVTGQVRPALIQEEDGAKEHFWRARSRIKTGTHSDYRSDGVHLLDEHTAYSITVHLAVDRNNSPLLYIGPYIRSKLMGGMPIAASDFQMDVPVHLKGAIGTKTGIQPVELDEYRAALTI